MKVKLSSIVEGIEFQTDEAESYLNIKTGEVVLFTNEEIRAAEEGEDLSDRQPGILKISSAPGIIWKMKRAIYLSRQSTNFTNTGL